MYENSIIAFSADNGGAPGVGSNYPLRGCKSTFFEGGVRSVAFIHSPLLPAASRGTKLDGLMYVMLILETQLIIKAGLDVASFSCQVNHIMECAAVVDLSTTKFNSNML